MTKQELLDLANDDEMMEVARIAIEAKLVEFRDARISLLMRGNGLVIRETDGTDSYIIRLGAETAVSIALRAIAETK